MVHECRPGFRGGPSHGTPRVTRSRQRAVLVRGRAALDRGLEESNRGWGQECSGSLSVRPMGIHTGSDSESTRKHDRVIRVLKGVSAHARSCSPRAFRKTWSCCGSTGLTRWWSKPAFLERCLSSSCPYPVMAISTMFFASGVSRRRSATWYPLSPGSPMSNVHEDHVWPKLLCRLDCAHATVGQVDLVSHQDQNHAQALGSIHIVVHHQQSERPAGQHGWLERVFLGTGLIRWF